MIQFIIYLRKKKYNIKDDINKYSERDNKQGIIKPYNLEFVETFNPYYKGDKYSFKSDYGFNYLNLDDNNNQFIKTSRKLEFERMFKDNIIEYLNKIVSKINEYFSLLKNKYEYIMNNVKKDKKSFTDKQLKEEIKIITKFFYLIRK